MLKINLTCQAGKLFAKLTQNHKRQVAEKIQSLQGNHRPGESNALKGHEGYLGVGSGEYHGIYRIDGGCA